MYKFLIFIGSSIIVYWLINGDIDFYKIATGVLFILLGFFKEMTDYWKHEATRYCNISTRMYMDIDTLYGKGAADKLISLTKANTFKRLKELKDSGKEIPYAISKELKSLKAELEKETTAKE